MDIETYKREKEDLEVRLMNLVNDEIREFQHRTGVMVHDIDVVLFNAVWDDDKNEVDLGFPNKVTDINIMAIQ